MNIKLFRFIALGLLTLGTAIGITAIDTFSPIKILNLFHFDQPVSQQVLAQDAEEATNVRVYQQASPAVVSINTNETTGSGSIVSADGLILTNAHVVQGFRVVTVVLADGREVTADVVGFGEPGLDLAAVRLRERGDFPTLPIAPANSVQVGQRAFAIGNPFGQFQGTLTTGIISRVDRDRGLIQTDAAINPGNSGGPLLNSNAELIGVNTAIFAPSGSAGNIGIGFAIPVERIQPFLAAVREGRAAQTAQQPNPGFNRPPQRIALSSNPIQGRLTINSNVLPADNSYFDAYTFEGRAGQRIEIVMMSNQLDAYLILVAPDGSDLAQDDDSAGGTNAKIDITLPVSGTYTVLANSYGAGEVGSYNLRVAALSDARMSSPVQPPVAQEFILEEEGVLGVNSLVLQTDGSLYREHVFRGNAGQTVTIRLESGEFSPYLILVGPTNEIIAQNGNIRSTQSNAEIHITLPQTGIYRIIANAADASGRGRYRLTIR
jgi:serine protease Do